MGPYHVLCEALGKDWLKTFLDEMAESKCILVSISTGKALIGHVEEWEMTTLLDGISNLHPLLLGRVNTSRVVSASMEEDDAALGEVLDVFDQSLEVETNGVLVVVSVLLNLEA